MHLLSSRSYCCEDTWRNLDEKTSNDIIAGNGWHFKKQDCLTTISKTTKIFVEIMEYFCKKEAASQAAQADPLG